MAVTEKIVVTGEDRASQAFNKAGGSFEGMAQKISNVAKGAGLVIAAQQIIQLGVSAVKSAVDAGEAAAAFETTFGPAVGRAGAFVESFANKAGFARHELEQMLAITGNVVQGIGATEEQSAELSIAMATLAGDVASFSNAQGGAQAVMAALQSAINGEREALKTYGLAISEAEVGERALLDTGKERIDQLTRLEKAEATVAVAMEKAGKAVGDLDRTQDSAANQLRQISAAAKEAGVDLGAAILTGLAPMLPTVKELIPTIGSTVTATAKLLAAVGPLANAVLKLLNPAFNALAGYLNLVDKGLTSIQSAWDAGARAELRMGEATEFLNEALANGEDPATALANSLRHIASDGELTKAQFDELAAASGLSAERITDVQRTLIDYSKSGQDANVTTGELIGAFGTAAGTAYEYEDAGLRMIRMQREAAGVAKEELSPGMAEVRTRMAEAKKAASDAGLAFRNDLVSGMQAAVTGVEGAIEELDIALDEYEDNLEERVVQQATFYENLALLAAAGYGDLATELESGGAKTAGIVADAVADMEEAGRLDEMIANAKADTVALADAYASALENPDQTMFQNLQKLGWSLADAIAYGFTTRQLGSTLIDLVDQAAGAITPWSPPGGGGGSQFQKFHEGGVVPDLFGGGPVPSLLMPGEVVSTAHDYAQLTQAVTAMATTRGSGDRGGNVNITIEVTSYGGDGHRIARDIENELAQSQLIRRLPERL